MEQHRIALLVGAAALTAALAVGTLATGFAQGMPQPGFGPGMMGGWGQVTLGQAQPITSLDDAKHDFQRYINAPATRTWPSTR